MLYIYFVGLFVVVWQINRKKQKEWNEREKCFNYKLAIVTDCDDVTICYFYNVVVAV